MVRSEPIVGGCSTGMATGVKLNLDIFAALHGHSSVVRFLMEDCGYSTQACDAAGHTPTMDAQIAGHAEIAKLLESH